MRALASMLVLLAALVAVPGAAAKARPSHTVRWATPNPYINPPDSRYGAPTDTRAKVVKPYVLVRLPKGYRKSRKKCYPVLYLLHGHGYTDEWERRVRGNLKRTAKGFK